MAPISLAGDRGEAESLLGLAMVQDGLETHKEERERVRARGRERERGELGKKKTRKKESKGRACEEVRYRKYGSPMAIGESQFSSNNELKIRFLKSTRYSCYQHKITTLIATFVLMSQ